MSDFEIGVRNLLIIFLLQKMLDIFERAHLPCLFNQSVPFLFVAIYFLVDIIFHGNHIIFLLLYLLLDKLYMLVGGLLVLLDFS
jgi:hypothetical protein